MLILKPLIKLRNCFSLHIAVNYDKYLTDWEPDIFPTVTELADYCYGHLKWEADSIIGLMDHIQPIRHMNWQVETYDRLNGDCDDLATWIGYMLKRMGCSTVKRVNIVRHRHVICVFYNYKIEKWQYFSNRSLKQGLFNSTRECVDAYCKGRNLKSTRMYYTENI